MTISCDNLAVYIYTVVSGGTEGNLTLRPKKEEEKIKCLNMNIMFDMNIFLHIYVSALFLAI